MTILVTGCAGYIGSMLVDILTKRDSETRVIGVDNLIYNNGSSIQGFLGRSNFEFYKKDVRDINSLKNLLNQSSTLIHLSALVGASICDKYPDYATSVNQKATEDLSNIFNGKIIYANTNSGYGANGGLCTEDTPINPVSLYGETKLAAEKAVLDNGGVSLRLATVFGSSFRQRMDLMVNDFCSKLYFKKGITLFEPHFKRNFIHVRDVVNALILAMDPSVQGIFNIGLDSANCTKLELAKKVVEIVNPKASIQIGEGSDPDRRDYNIQSTKFLNATGWKPYYSLSKGILEIKNLCEIFSENKLKSMGNYTIE